MWYAVYDPKTKQLISTASEIDLNVISQKKLSYKTYDGDEGDVLELKTWDKETQDFIDIPELVMKSKQELIDEIALYLNLTPEQKSKLSEKL